MLGRGGMEKCMGGLLVRRGDADIDRSGTGLASVCRFVGSPMSIQEGDNGRGIAWQVPHQLGANGREDHQKIGSSS